MTTLYWKGGKYVNEATGRANLAYPPNWCTDVGLTTRYTGATIAGQDLRLDGTGTIESEGETRSPVSFRSLYGVREGTNRDLLLWFGHPTTITGGAGAQFVKSGSCYWDTNIAAEIFITGALELYTLPRGSYWPVTKGPTHRFVSGTSVVPVGKKLVGRVFVESGANLDFSGATLDVYGDPIYGSPTSGALNFSYSGSSLTLTAAGMVTCSNNAPVRGYVKGAITISRVTVQNGAIFAFSAVDGGNNGAQVYFSVTTANPYATTLYWKGGGHAAPDDPGYWMLESAVNWCTDAALTVPFTGNDIRHCDLRFDSTGTIVGPAMQTVGGYFFSSIDTRSSYPGLALGASRGFSLHGKGATNESIIDTNKVVYCLPPIPITFVDDIQLWTNGGEPDSPNKNNAPYFTVELGTLTVPTTKTLYTYGIKILPGANLDFADATVQTVRGGSCTGFLHLGGDLDFATNGTLIVDTSGHVSAPGNFAVFSEIRSAVTVSHIDASGGDSVVALAGPATDGGNNDNIIFQSALYWKGGNTVVAGTTDFDFCASDNWCLDEALTIPFSGPTVNNFYLKFSTTTDPVAGQVSMSGPIECVSMHLTRATNIVVFNRDILLTFANPDCPFINELLNSRFTGILTVAPTNDDFLAEFASAQYDTFTYGEYPLINVVGGTFKVGYTGAEVNGFACGSIYFGAGSLLEISGDYDDYNGLWVVGNADVLGVPNTGTFTFDGDSLVMSTEGSLNVLNFDSFRAATADGTIDIQNLNAGGGAPLYANTGPAVDLGGNTNVVFTDVTPTVVYWQNVSQDGALVPANCTTDKEGTLIYGGADFLGCDIHFNGEGPHATDAANAAEIICGSIDLRDAVCTVNFFNTLTLDGSGETKKSYISDAAYFVEDIVLHNGVEIEAIGSNEVTLGPLVVIGNVTISGNQAYIYNAAPIGCCVKLQGYSYLQVTATLLRLIDWTATPAILPDAGVGGVYGSGAVKIELNDRLLLPTQVNTKGVTLEATDAGPLSYEFGPIGPDIEDLFIGSSANGVITFTLNSYLEQLQSLTIYGTVVGGVLLAVNASEDINFRFGGSSFSVIANGPDIEVDFSGHTIDISTYQLYLSCTDADLTIQRGPGLTFVSREISVFGTPNPWEASAQGPQFVATLPNTVTNSILVGGDLPGFASQVAVWTESPPEGSTNWEEVPVPPNGQLSCFRLLSLGSTRPRGIIAGEADFDTGRIGSAVNQWISGSAAAPVGHLFTSMYQLVGRSVSDLYAAGEDGSPVVQLIAHWNGQEWSTLPKPPVFYDDNFSPEKYTNGMVLLPDNKLMTCGSYVWIDKNTLQQKYIYAGIYDPLTNTWSYPGGILTDTDPSVAVRGNALTLDGQGRPVMAHSVGTAWNTNYYSVWTGAAWVEFAPTIPDFFFSSFGASPSGDFYVVGYDGANDCPVVYQLVGGVWTQVGDLSAYVGGYINCMTFDPAGVLYVGGWTDTTDVLFRYNTATGLYESVGGFTTTDAEIFALAPYRKFS